MNGFFFKYFFVQSVLIEATFFLMYPVESQPLEISMVDKEAGVESYGIVELIWGIILLLGIFSVNISVLWVVSRSRELWKPRHLWMACLCITDIFVGAHKALELLIVALPHRELCVLQRYARFSGINVSA